VETRIIEATNDVNHGKFMLCRFVAKEWGEPGALHTISDLGNAKPERSVLAARGWSTRHIFVMDLQTGEGAMFLPGGYAKADLDKHKIWVCPMFEPFLTWLYTQDLTDLQALPRAVQVEGESALAGYRRPGPDA
jgi:hypothetical protein